MQLQAIAMLESEIKKSDAMQRLLTVLLTARQLYAAGIHVLATMTEEMPWPPLEVPSGEQDALEVMLAPAEDTRRQQLQSIVVNSVAANAGQAFTFEGLLKAIRSISVPWLETETQLREQQARKVYEEQRNTAEAARKAQRISLSPPLPADVGDLPRDEPVYLVGHREKLREVFDQLAMALQSKESERLTLKHVHQAVVLREFRLLPPTEAALPATSWCQLVEMSDWQEKFSSKVERMALFRSVIGPGLSMPLDLFVLEDLFPATRASSGTAAIKAKLSVAAEAVWAATQHLNCLTVLGVPLSATEAASPTFTHEVVSLLSTFGRPVLVGFEGEA